MKEGIQLYRQGRYQEALVAFLKADLSPDEYPAFSYNLGLCYAKLRQYDEALLYLEQVIGTELGFAQVYQCRMLIGYIYAETQRLRLASFEFRKLLDEGYESAKVYSALGHVLYLDRRLDDSLDCLENALRLDPDNANALNSAGYVMAERETKLNIAFMYCSRAVKARPEYPVYLDSLGWVLHKMGNKKDAVGILRKALGLSPGNALVKEHLQKALNVSE